MSEPAPRRARRPNLSAGLLLFRRGELGLQVFLAHPGGPFWRDRDAGAWTIPKGIVNEGEELLAAACREFEEETGIRPREPFLPLGSIRQKAGKIVHAWAWEGDAEPSRGDQQQRAHRVAAGLGTVDHVPRGGSVRLVRSGGGSDQDQSGAGGADRPAGAAALA